MKPSTLAAFGDADTFLSLLSAAAPDAAGADAAVVVGAFIIEEASRIRSRDSADAFLALIDDGLKHCDDPAAVIIVFEISSSSRVSRSDLRAVTKFLTKEVSLASTNTYGNDLAALGLLTWPQERSLCVDRIREYAAKPLNLGAPIVITVDELHESTIRELVADDMI